MSMRLPVRYSLAFAPFRRSRTDGRMATHAKSFPSFTRASRASRVRSSSFSRAAASLPPRSAVSTT